MSVKITLDYRKSLDENAGLYFDKAKKAKKKIEGIILALEKFEREKKALEKKSIKHAQTKRVEPKKAQHWYEKFRWFVSSEGILCVGGRDATQNEILIKKHLEKNDLVFHTDLAGSPFFLAKIKDIPAGQATKEEVAAATVSYSKAWKLGLSSAEVFYVHSDQVSKKAESGEYLTKGSFMIRGKRTYLTSPVGLAIGIVDGNLIAGPKSAIEAQTDRYVLLTQGDQKPSDVAKKIKKDLGYSGHIDDVIRFLPSGKAGVRKRQPKR